MKHLFILNPVAGKGRTLKLIPEINSCFENRHDEYIIETTKYPGHATEIAASYAAKGTYRIYSVGGDGTLNEVLNGMAGSLCSLAAIPSGSGNDFIKSLNFNSDMKNIITRTVEGEEHLIDYARINDKYFINITSMGFDAQVVRNTVGFKKLPLISGQAAYILGVLATILKCENNFLEIQIDESNIKTKSLLIAVGNGRFYGGGMLAVPDAKIDDGQFDICLIENMGRLKILLLLPKYMKGLHGSIKGVHFHRGKRVEITPLKPIAMNIDGEIDMVSKAVFEIIPKGLRFVVPI